MLGLTIGGQLKYDSFFLYIISHKKQPNLSKFSTKKENTKIRLLFLSVPLRGLWFLSVEPEDISRKPSVVSVPLRGLWFLSSRIFSFMAALARICFRPLTGIMVLIIGMKYELKKNSISFRPLTGIMVLIGLGRGSAASSDVFPSPYGDYGSYQDRPKLKELWRKWFPSPYGDYGSYLFDLVRACTSQYYKFPSPYGDYGSYQHEKSNRYFNYGSAVSVPLRGLWFLSALPA